MHIYEVDSQDRVIKLPGLPQSCSGAPLPQLLATENRLLLAYIVSEPDPHWDGTYVQMVSPATDNLPIAIVDFRSATHMFGPPNDEAILGHPLASRGLRFYGNHEVLNSSWIRRLERMNSVHPQHNRERFIANRRHFIFTFHDTTFECVAKDCVWQPFRGSMREAFGHMLEMIEADES